ncbi:MAG: polyribonucleotide nucleotidyltransferase [Deltaproteobacteria bacterium]|nr:polyribonucleotide nucleotidyltransferase [Candidatus Anaeroferrophillus wilburensis]MBN2888926.1 polyribonucleotide nucleotidyltransferase [Deltaproteobacteria bacterium]
MQNFCQIEVEKSSVTLETGKMAKQASGAVVVRAGDTVVLVTAVAERKGREGIDFFPLTVDYREKTYAAGKIPGGFFKRESRPSDRETLTSRLIDRPIRPLFPKGFSCETQVIATVLSVDGQHDADVLALTGASAALMISDIPFAGPVAGVRVGRIDGRLIANPSVDQMAESDLDLVMACSREAVVMVEGGAHELAEEIVVEALEFGHQAAQPFLQAQQQMAAKVGRQKRQVVAPQLNEQVSALVQGDYGPRFSEGLAINDKLERRDYFSDLKGEIAEKLGALEIPVNDLGEIFEHQLAAAIRKQIHRQGVRIGGRSVDEVRQITTEVGLLPRVHGSALFTRGETQALVTVTLGTSSDEQRIDALLGESFKRFMLHYNFPPYSVGEARFLRGPGRREIGHGTLAERALTPVLPAAEQFPYTIRVVSEVLESNGSSSMATVCGGSLSLMDGGVPIKAPVAGIAMGLVKEGDDFIVLTDILGDEDHVGDMDFKVAGTREGITAIQMDIKVTGISQEIMKKALSQAREGRLKILGVMEQSLAESRADISTYAPRILTITVHQDKIRDVIGPGGKNIRAIVEKTGAKIDIEDSGEIKIASADEKASAMAIAMIRDLTQEAEVGKIYLGKVQKIMDFGAFVEIFPGTDGLVHISQLAHERVRDVRDILKEGDEVLVKVLEIDRQGKIKLSRKDALDSQA